MYVAHLEFYRERLPGEVQGFRASFPRRRRELLLRDMAICVKHRRWDRAREGLAIWRDDLDPLLRAMGRTLGSPMASPEWYSAGAWQKTHFA
jgi:hypothetical protein